MVVQMYGQLTDVPHRICLLLVLLCRINTVVYHTQYIYTYNILKYNIYIYYLYIYNYIKYVCTQEDTTNAPESKNANSPALSS